MTRINVIPVQHLTDQHLLAEVREIVRMPNYLKKSLNSKKGFKIQDIPDNYTMGKGHVKFFYNKFSWLEQRFLLLLRECKNRNFEISNKDTTIFKNVPIEFKGDYSPNYDDFRINRLRLIERIKTNRSLYRFYGKKHDLITGDKVTFINNDVTWTANLVNGNTYIINVPYMSGYTLLDENLVPTGWWAEKSMLELHRVKDTKLARKIFPEGHREGDWWILN